MKAATSLLPHGSWLSCLYTFFSLLQLSPRFPKCLYLSHIVWTYFNLHIYFICKGGKGKLLWLYFLWGGRGGGLRVFETTHNSKKISERPINVDDNIKKRESKIVGAPMNLLIEWKIPYTHIYIFHRCYLVYHHTHDNGCVSWTSIWKFKSALCKGGLLPSEPTNTHKCSCMDRWWLDWDFFAQSIYLMFYLSLLTLQIYFVPFHFIFLSTNIFHPTFWLKGK